MRRAAIAGLALCGGLLLGGSAPDGPTAPSAEEIHRSLDNGVAKLPGPLKGLFGLTLGIGPSWYKNVPGYVTDILPYVKNDARFSEIMNKYRENRELTEDERLEAVAELNIPQIAPDWLDAVTKAKIQRVLERSGQHQLGSSSSIQYAEAVLARPPGDQVVRDTPDNLRLAQEQAVVLPIMMFGTMVTVELMPKIVSWMELSDPTLHQINDSLTPAAQAAIEKRNSEFCQTHACSKADIKPKVVPPPVAVGVGEGDAKGLPPCRTVSGRIVAVGTIAFRPLDNPLKPQHGIEGPHYNIFKANQNPYNGKCFWQNIGAVAPMDLPKGAIPIEPFANL